MNILIAESLNYSATAMNIYQSLGKVQLAGEQNFHDLLSESEVLVVRLKYNFSEDTLSMAPGLKYIVSPTTGLDHIDLEYCRKKGIKVLSLQGETDFLNSITATAEHSFALLLSLLRKIPSAVNHVKEGKWNRNLFIGNSLAKKTLGIVGMGRVGQQVAQMAVAFSMKVRYYDIKTIQLKQALINHCIKDNDIKRLIKESDIVSIHIPLRGNELLFSEELLSLFDQSKYLINTSRGKIIDEKYLMKILQDGQIGGVALDVLENELTDEKRIESPILKGLNNNLPIIITPHIGGATIEAMHDTEVFMANKLKTAIQYP